MPFDLTPITLCGGLALPFWLCYLYYSKLIGNWELGIGNWALAKQGIGHWLNRELAKQGIGCKTQH
ncbi:hypothetical protein [Microcoleus sp. bin38.metabat.b11b12b14.051]|uniref:hypothetical protein n=1 Tax=Microcoleus sp. bin38.metabat.b11b12b14.051 TaxID=2742709 RepID=UPI0025E5C80F|nr:hypothetical protein [Microcoleus sp. bin38.metabat.b11b12b14.051]